MSKKILFTIGLLMISIFTLATTFSFATDGKSAVNTAVNDVRNVVGGAENAIEGAVNNVGNTVNNATHTTGNTMHNAGNTVTNGTNHVGNTVTNNGTNYTANRTATTRTTANTGTFLGMSSTMWTWIVLAVAVVAIVALVWYYSNRLTNSRRYDDE